MAALAIHMDAFLRLSVVAVLTGDPETTLRDAAASGALRHARRGKILYTSLTWHREWVEEADSVRVGGRRRPRRRQQRYIGRVKLLAAEQGFKCAVCGRAFADRSEAAIDHDHETALVRGLLCHSCNVMEGSRGLPRRAEELLRYRDNPPAGGRWVYAPWARERMLDV